MVSRLGDVQASRLFSDFDRACRRWFAKLAAREIDRTDGFLVLFSRPLEALECALSLHEEAARLGGGYEVELRLRVGIHLGEVVVHLPGEEGTQPVQNLPPNALPRMRFEVDGLAKVVASRLCSLAQPGQTLLTRAAFDLAQRASVGTPIAARRLEWLAHGAYTFAGVIHGDAPKTEEVFEVGVSGCAPCQPPPDQPKAKRFLRPGEEAVLGWRPAPGRPIPRREDWKLLHKLGAGGFGEVWLAECPRLGERRVFKFCFDVARLRALKRELALFRLLRDALGDREDIQRVLGIDLSTSPYFLELEYAEGGDLLAWFDARGTAPPLPIEARVEIAARIATALAAAHSVGVIHKDIKPSNVLIRGPQDVPRVCLADFGIGAVANQEALERLRASATVFKEGTGTLTRDSTSGQTPIYTAPEILEGREPSIESDLYVLGVLLYQLAVGDLHRAVAPGCEREIADEFLREDVLACLRRDPSERLHSAHELAARLRSLPERRRTAEEAERMRRLAEDEARRAEQLARRRRTFIVGVVVALLVSCSLLASGTYALRSRSQADRVRTASEEQMLSSLKTLLQMQAQATSGSGAHAFDVALDYLASIPEEERTSLQRLLEAAALTARAGEQHPVGALPYEDGGAMRDGVRALEILRGMRASLPDRVAEVDDLLVLALRAAFVAPAIMEDEELLEVQRGLTEQVGELLRTIPPESGARLEFALHIRTMAENLRLRKRLPEARQLLERASIILQEYAQAVPTNSRARLQMLKTEAEIIRLRSDETLDCDSAAQLDLYSRTAAFDGIPEYADSLTLLDFRSDLLRGAMSCAASKGDRELTCSIATRVLALAEKRIPGEGDARANWIQRDPGHAIAYARDLMAVADASFQIGDLERAEVLVGDAIQIRRGVESSPTHYDPKDRAWVGSAIRYRGKIRLARGDAKGAAADCDEALQRFAETLELIPGDPDTRRWEFETLLLRARARMTLGHEEQARADLTRVLAIATEPAVAESNGMRLAALEAHLLLGHGTEADALAGLLCTNAPASPELATLLAEFGRPPCTPATPAR